MRTPPPAPPSRWVMKPTDNAVVDAIRGGLDVEHATAEALARRGIATAEEADAFLHPSMALLHDPHLMRDLDAAVERIRRALSDKETILVHGDYDVDGLAATGLLVRCLSLLGGTVRAHIPDRLREGYGLSDGLAEIAAQAGASLVISCDCGVRAGTIATSLRERGIDLVVTDHHEPDGELPRACAVVDPKRDDCGYPFKDLAGVGVAFKVCQALSEACGVRAANFQRAYLDLVALGTIADVVPLLGENRVLAAHGLDQLRQTRKVGLRALIRRAGLDGQRIDAYHVGFVLGPRLNAAGRIDHAQSALTLLMTGDRNEADSITGRLERANQERQSIEAAMVTDALDRLAVDRGYADGDPIVVLAAEGWHRGVAGLVAGAIRERYGRPAFVLCIEDGIAVGSARGVDGLSLSDAVDSAGDLISHGGGHAMAAGVTLPAENIGAFRRAVNEYARTVLGNDELAPTHAYEAELEPDQITVRLTNQLQLLAPFGQGNPRPAFVTRGLAVEYAYTFGRQNRHLKIGLSAAGRTINGLLYRRGDRLPEVQPGMRLDVLYTLRTEVRSGVAQLELVLQDMRRSDAA